MSAVAQSSERLGPSAIRTDLPALLFPGQGSETPDMRAMVERERPDLLRLAIELVGADPFAEIERGTRFVQPAVLCASLALWSAADLEPACVTGHSLGEFSALGATVANDNAPTQVVLSGSRDVLEQARNAVTCRGSRRVGCR